MNTKIKNLEIVADFFSGLLVSNIPMSQKILFRNCNTVGEIQSIILPLLEAEYSKELDWLYSITQPVEISFPREFYLICEN